jgi:hypothetical protein
MRMNFGEVLRIEDLGKHSAATVIHLGILLAGPVNVAPDPKRKHFYEIQGGQTVYYIHVSPVTGTIFLLATWKSLAGPGEALIRSGRYRRPDCEARPEPRTVATGTCLPTLGTFSDETRSLGTALLEDMQGVRECSPLQFEASR